MNQRWRLYELLLSVVSLSVGLSVLSWVSLTLVAHHVRINTRQRLSAQAMALVELAKDPAQDIAVGITHFHVDGSPSLQSADFRLRVARTHREHASFETETVWVSLYEGNHAVIRLSFVRGVTR